ncbi:MAG: DUF116 domain-containing protein [bacterium]
MKKTRYISNSVGSATPILYVSLAFATCLIFTLVAWLLAYLLSPALAAWHPLAARIVFPALVAPFVAGALFFFSEAISFSMGRDYLAFIPFAMRRALVMPLFPFCRLLGGLLGRSAEAVSASCIAFNNRIARGARQGRKKGGLLVLLPRCIQHSECTQQIIDDVASCKRCGKCAIARLMDLMESHAFTMVVVAGGERAKEIVADLSPSGVIAVACESELVKGLQAISRIPVIAVPNRRPKGPCRDTVIDLEEFERILISTTD